MKARILWIKCRGKLRRLDTRSRLSCLFLLVSFACALSADAQRVRGELHIDARDPQGAALASTAELVSEVTQLHRAIVLGSDGRYVVQDLAFGRYRLALHAKGFAPWTALIDIRSEVPVHVAATLALPPVSTQVDVNESATLVDPYRTGTVYSIGQR